ncbi:MAG: DUF6468 domain-containing protein [Candidatus Eiseniibacteriota bacterium]
MTLSMLFDGLLAVLLATTIVYAAILNRKLKQLRQGEGEMKRLLAEFSTSSAKAEASLGQLKALAGQAQVGRGGFGGRDGAAEFAALRQELDRGQALKDDLAFLVDRGEALADRLGTTISEAREAARPNVPLNLSAVPVTPAPMPTAAAGAAAAKPRKAGGASVAERELLKALRAARPER